MRAFSKAAVTLALGLYCVAAAGASNKAFDAVNLAVEAMGGENAPRQVRTMVITEKMRYDAGRHTYTVLLDLATGLPERVRLADTDPHMGDVNYDLVLSGWQGAPHSAITPRELAAMVRP
jgi:hypothetical protein